MEIEDQESDVRMGAKLAMEGSGECGGLTLQPGGALHVSDHIPGCDVHRRSADPENWPAKKMSNYCSVDMRYPTPSQRIGQEFNPPHLHQEDQRVTA